jgi:hypothetical protein
MAFAPRRLRQLASRCGKYAAQPLTRFDADQRHTLLAAYLPDLSASLIDQTLDMLDKILDELVRKGNKKQERHFQSNVRAQNANLARWRSQRRAGRFQQIDDEKGGDAWFKHITGPILAELVPHRRVRKPPAAPSGRGRWAAQSATPPSLSSAGALASAAERW